MALCHSSFFIVFLPTGIIEKKMACVCLKSVIFLSWLTKVPPNLHLNDVLVIFQSKPMVSSNH